MPQRRSVRNKYIDIIRDAIPPLETRPTPVEVEGPVVIARLPRRSINLQSVHLGEGVFQIDAVRQLVFGVRSTNYVGETRSRYPDGGGRLFVTSVERVREGWVETELVVAGYDDFMGVGQSTEPPVEIAHLVHVAALCKITAMDEDVSVGDRELDMGGERVRVAHAHNPHFIRGRRLRGLLDL